VFDEVEGSDFSRIPICGDLPEQLTGVVLKDDILLRAARGQGETRLDEIRRDFLSVDENEPLTQMLERLIKGPGVIADVTGRYGGLSGIVTLEDLVEFLIVVSGASNRTAINDEEAIIVNPPSKLMTNAKR